jgi:hypothetical protein
VVSKTYPVLALVTFFIVQIGTGYVSPGESVTSENTGYAAQLLFGAKMRSPNPFFNHRKEQNMSSNPILSRLQPGLTRFGAGISHFHWLWPPKSDAPRPNLHDLYAHQELLPEKVTASPEAMHCLNLLGPLDWGAFPERDLQRDWGQETTPYSAFAATCLLKIDQRLSSFSHLADYLADHPEMAWLLGFPSINTGQETFQPNLPTSRHFPRLLHKMPNACLQFLLGDSIKALFTEFQRRDIAISETVSLDTKHILAWVKENNPKTYIKSDRFNKEQQPPGDPDCKLGCKRRHNQRASSQEPPPTPTSNPVPAGTISVGEFYWGYASGVVACKVPDWGEFVLAEMTQPFDQPDVSYFFPLMSMVEQRLGHKPRFGTLDAAFDAWYIYEYFHNPGQPGFAAIPFSEKGGIKSRKFTPDGAPFCAADLPMPLHYTFASHTSLVEHQMQRYACPLLYPQATGETCPQNHKNFAKGGCTSTLPASIGSRLRYTLNRESQSYKEVYRQRTAAERIFGQATEMGIERPHLRNGLAIANLNTLIYTLLNLRLLQRIRQRE